MNDGRSRTEEREEGWVGGIKAPHSHLEILTRGLDRLLTHIGASQTQDTSVAAAEHAADDVSQDACAHLGLDGQNKGQRASCDSSEEERPIGGKINKQKEETKQTRDESLGLEYCKKSSSGIDGLCNCGGCPGPISFQVNRQKDKPTMVCSVRVPTQIGAGRQNHV